MLYYLRHIIFVTFVSIVGYKVNRYCLGPAMETRRVLITGASGLLGRALYSEFKSDPGWATLGLAFSRARGELRKVDITDCDQMTAVVNEFKPHVIIHAAAERKPDVVETQPEATKRLNIEATQIIADIAVAMEILLVFISTDYVFDGTTPPHEHDTPPNPLNAYGRSKLEGEKVVLSANEGNVVLRVPILYGDVETADESAITIMYPKVKDNTQEFVTSDYERRYPTHCGDVAYILRQLLSQRLKDNSLSGIFQWSGDEEMTKYDMCIEMAQVMNLTSSHIKPNQTPSSGATRPYNAHLSSQRIEALGIKKRRPFKEGVKSSLESLF